MDIWQWLVDNFNRARDVVEHWYDNLRAIIDRWGSFWAFLFTIALDIPGRGYQYITNLLNLYLVWYDNLERMARDWWANIYDFFTSVIWNAIAVLRTYWDELWDLVARLWGKLHLLVTDLWFTLYALVTGLWAYIWVLATQKWGQFWDLVDTWYYRIADVVNTYFFQFQDFFSNLFGGAQVLLRDWWTSVSDFFSRLYGLVRYVFDDLWPRLWDYLWDMYYRLRDYAYSYFFQFHDFFSNLFYRAQVMLRDWWDDLNLVFSTKVQDIRMFLTDPPGTIWAWLEATLLPRIEAFLNERWDTRVG